jgi:hypothetical protein
MLLENITSDKRSQFQIIARVSECTVALARGQFGKPGRGTSAVGTRHQRTGERKQTEKTELPSARNRVRL